ncbi:trypsin-like serine peptidase [Herbidospora sp. RD11066]
MKRTLALGGVAAGLLASALVTQPANAAGDVASDALATTGIAAKNIAALWLTEGAANLINAQPYNVETTVPSKHVSSGGPTADTKPGVVPAIGDEKKTTSTSKNINLPKTTGKVFFADGAKWDREKRRWVAVNPKWCTATSIQSTYRNLVATAGNCVYDTETNSATMNYWAFVPGYYQGKAPWGIYVGKQAFTHYDYDVYEDSDRNYAFVTVYNGIALGAPTPTEITKAEYDAYQKNGGKHLAKEISTGEGDKKVTKYFAWKYKDAGRLGDNVGGQGFAYNQKVGQSVYVFGYPSGSHPDGNQAYTGKTLKWSYGKTFAAKAAAIKAEEIIGVKSSFTGQGSLGSAWLSQYKNTRRLGYLNGVTIGVSDTDGNKRIDTSLSSYFDGETYGVYKAASNLWTGSIV